MIKKMDTVVLATDLLEYGLIDGDIGAVVLVHREAKGVEVEFVALDGKTIAVATLPAEKVRTVRHGEIPHARWVASA